MWLEHFGAHGDAAQTGLGFFDFCQADDAQSFFDGMIPHVGAVFFLLSILSPATLLRSLLHELETRAQRLSMHLTSMAISPRDAGNPAERFRAGSSLQPD